MKSDEEIKQAAKQLVHRDGSSEFEYGARWMRDLISAAIQAERTKLEVAVKALEDMCMRDYNLSNFTKQARPFVAKARETIKELEGV